MAGGFCRGRAAPAVESKIFFSRSDRPEISIRQKLNKERMEIPGSPCRKEPPWYMMNVSERQKMETINTPYDDTFRTLLQDCPELVVPLINELFGTNYTGREVVVSNENEIFFRNPEGEAGYGFQPDIDFFKGNFQTISSGMSEHSGWDDGNSDVGI